MSKKHKHEDEYSWGYGSVTYQDCWNLDTKLAGIIAEHLHAFLNAEKFSTGRGCPGVLSEQFGDRAMSIWLGIIRKMLFAFENYNQTKYQPEKEEDTQAKIREGMQLFIEYFEHLWI